MLAPELAASMIEGVTIVTPNKRLARRLSALHDQAQQAQGVGAWPSPPVLPWSAWVTSVWRDLAASAADGVTVPVLLSDVEAAFLWAAVVAGSDAANAALFDVTGAAALASKAWEVLHAYSAGGQSWRAWRSLDDIDTRSDEATFAQWAESYQRELLRHSACDRSTVCDVLARSADASGLGRGRRVVLAGFLELTPQQRRLQIALERDGASIISLPTTLSTGGQAMLVSGETRRDELQRALSWARQFARNNRNASVAIAVADLAERREEVRALAEEVLCPDLQWPGQELTPRPYDISLGVPLAEVPIVATALDLLSIAHGPIATADAAALLRSLYLPGSDSPARRAGLERVWLGEGRRTIRWGELAMAVRTVDRELGERFTSMREFAGRERLSMRNWVDVWRNWLDAAGWPGDVLLAHPEQAARGAWDELCAALARIDAVAPAQNGGRAFAQLRALAQEQVFQAEAATAPIAIMGVLEAAALPVDALWVGGLDAESWPPAPMPNPLLPIAWQRERNVPHSSAARELDYTRLLTGVLARGAPTVVLSFARTRDDYPSMPSMLAQEFATSTLPADAPGATDDTAPAAALANAAPALERHNDDHAPAWPAGTRAPGGAGLVVAQSDCPFRATAKYRLNVEPWPQATDGLHPNERGNLVHATLNHFFGVVGSHAELAAMSAAEIDAKLAVAATSACTLIAPSRWALLPPTVAALEPLRLRGIAHEWIDKFERPRPPYTVRALETKFPLSLGGLELSLRFDRVDTLPQGGVLMIDYKTGNVAISAQWFRERPREPQLGLYTLAWQQHYPEVPVQGVAYAQLQPGHVGVIGLGANADVWPVLPLLPKGTGVASFEAAKAWWGQHLPLLADAFRRGEAAVAPRDKGEPCRTCGFASLCRIVAIRDELEDAD